MPNLTIYVPRDLDELVRNWDVEISKTCQAALRRKVRIAERKALDAARGAPSPAARHAEPYRQPRQPA